MQTHTRLNMNVFLINFRQDNCANLRHRLALIKRRTDSYTTRKRRLLISMQCQRIVFRNFLPRGDRIWKPTGGLKVDVEHRYISPFHVSLFVASSLNLSVTMIASVVGLSFFEATQRRARVTASISIAKLDIATRCVDLSAPLS